MRRESPGRLTAALLLLLLLLLRWASVAEADGAPAPASDADAVGLARRRFATGQWLYEHARYREALVELEAARAIAPRPEMEFNIGLCLERLGRVEDAAAALDRYRSATGADTAEVRELAAELHARATRSTRRHRRIGTAAIALGALGAGLLATAAATGGVVLGRRDDAARYDDNRRLAIATDVLIPIGAAAAVSAIVLGVRWGLGRRR